MTSKQKAESLLKYIEKYPQLRFWQALLSWSGYPFICISKKPPCEISSELEDTYYLKN